MFMNIHQRSSLDELRLTEMPLILVRFVGTPIESSLIFYYRHLISCFVHTEAQEKLVWVKCVGGTRRVVVTHGLLYKGYNRRIQAHLPSSDDGGNAPNSPDTPKQMQKQKQSVASYQLCLLMFVV